MAVEQQHAIAFILGCLDVGVLLFLVGGVEVDELVVLVFLIGLDEGLVLVEGEVFAVSVLHQGEVLGTVVEAVLREDAVVDEEFQVVPLLLILLAVLLEDRVQAVGHFLGDVGGDLLHLAVALQIRTAHVQGDVWRVDHTVEQGEELRHDALHLVGDEDLVAVELDLVLLQLDVRLDLGEVEDTREVEGVVDVQVDPEQGLVRHGVEGAVERLVVLVLQCRRGFRPQRFHIINNIVLVGIHLLAVLPFGLLAEGDGYGHELAVFVEQSLQLILVEELLAVVVDVEDDVRSVVSALGVVDLIGR